MKELRICACIAVFFAGCGLVNAEDLYNGTSYVNVRAAYQAGALSTDYIQANDDSTNGVPAGTVLIYRTGRGFFGKMRVDTCTTARFVFSYVTWSDSTTIESHDSLAVVRGTWMYDLDRGVEGTDTACDFWWTIANDAPPAQRSFIAKNGAHFAVWTGITGTVQRTAGPSTGIKPATWCAASGKPTVLLAFGKGPGPATAVFDLRGRGVPYRPAGQSPKLLVTR